MMNENHKTYNILIVDDVPNNIKVAANILQHEEYKLFFATNGSDALDKVQSNKFDLILLDVMMPEMDGFEVRKHVRDNPDTQDVPIIFLTAKTHSEDLLRGFEVGAVDYVTKPFKVTELLSRVSTHLELKRSRDIITAQNHQLALRHLFCLFQSFHLPLALEEAVKQFQ